LKYLVNESHFKVCIFSVSLRLLTMVDEQVHSE
jgi:hypothetical protein